MHCATPAPGVLDAVNNTHGFTCILKLVMYRVAVVNDKTSPRTFPYGSLREKWAYSEKYQNLMKGLARSFPRP